MPSIYFRRGFTLIELLVTLAILGTLATIALPMAELSVQRQREKELRAALRELRTAIDQYRQASAEGRIKRAAQESGYPPSLEVLVSGVEDATDPDKRKLYFLRRLPVDPFVQARSPQLPPAQQWGLRSYRSEPDDPKPGDDVFDVYSLAEGIGFNGQRYRDW